MNGPGRARIVATALAVATALTLVALPGCSRGSNELTIGAVYPLAGGQGPGGVEEYRGVRLAVRLANAGGGVHGRRVVLKALDVESADAAPAAVDQLAGEGVRFVLGSYGSTISEPAATEADRRGLLYWETGAVGQMSGAGQGRLVFRMAPSGFVLGEQAIEFIAERLAPLLHRSPSSLRFGVANVDDAYGNGVADGAERAVADLHLQLAGRFPYDPLHLDAAAVVHRIAASRPNVLFVAAYIGDGVALRAETVREHLPLVANIGTSSSYCMPAFGAALGSEAVGLFASDKPDGDALNEAGLLPSGRSLLDRARSAYRAAYHTDMSAAALAGFSGAWALLRSVMPRASELTPTGVGEAAVHSTIPPGGLPNGSGMRFGPAGTPDAGANLDAVGVIWEWTGVGRRVVVWPPRFATWPVEALPLAR